MADTDKKIIILDARRTQPGYFNINFLFWFAVPSGDEYPVSGAASRWSDATNSETYELQEGIIIEEPIHVQLPNNISAADMKTRVIDLYKARKDAFTEQQSGMGWPGAYFGTYWDGSDWTAG